MKGRDRQEVSPIKFQRGKGIIFVAEVGDYSEAKVIFSKNGADIVKLEAAFVHLNSGQSTRIRPEIQSSLGDMVEIERIGNRYFCGWKQRFSDLPDAGTTTVFDQSQVKEIVRQIVEIRNPQGV